jgi:AAA15 family ATPase/GTPase
MIFKEIEIKNFRGIKSAVIKGLSRVNLFVGKNNSGKSSILEAIFLLLNPSNPGAIVSIDNIRSLLHDEENDFRFSFNNLNYNNTIEINSVLHERESVRNIKIVPLTGKYLTQLIVSPPPTTTTSITVVSGGSTFDSSQREFVNGLEFEVHIKKYHTAAKDFKTSITLARAPGALLPNFQYGGAKDAEKESLQGLFQQATIKASFDLAQRLDKVIIEKHKEEIIQPLKEIDNKIVGFELGTKNIINFDIGLDRLIPANLMGDGVLKLLSICTNIYSAKGGVLLIDEIDNGLHFSTLKLLWKAIFSASKKNNCQLFVTSHNFELIKYLVEILEEAEFAEYKTEMSCYSITKNNRDKLLCSKYDFEKLEYSVEQEIEIRGNN